MEGNDREFCFDLATRLMEPFAPEDLREDVFRAYSNFERV